MTFTFIKGSGGKVGTSMVEDDKLDLALKFADGQGERCEHVPTDAVIADASAMMPTQGGRS